MSFLGGHRGCDYSGRRTNMVRLMLDSAILWLPGPGLERESDGVRPKPVCAGD